jgi:hypothetical protein
MSAVQLPEHMSYAEQIPERFKNIVFSDATSGKLHKNKMMGVSPKPNCRGRVTVVSKLGGYIPEKYGVDHSQYGGITVKCNLTSQLEADGCKFIDDKAVEKLTSKEAWPDRLKKGDKIPSEEYIRENYHPFLQKGKPKDVNDLSKGNWNSSIRGKIIEESKDKRVQPTRIIDFDGNPVSVDALPGKKFIRATWEIHFVYFMGTNIGLTVKLTYLKLAKDQSNSSVDPSFYDGLNELEYMDTATEGLPAETQAQVPLESQSLPSLELPPAPDAKHSRDQSELLAILGGDEQSSAPVTEGKRRKKT